MSAASLGPWRYCIKTLGNILLDMQYFSPDEIFYRGFANLSWQEFHLLDTQGLSKRPLCSRFPPPRAISRLFVFKGNQDHKIESVPEFMTVCHGRSIAGAKDKHQPKKKKTARLTGRKPGKRQDAIPDLLAPIRAASFFSKLFWLFPPSRLWETAAACKTHASSRSSVEICDCTLRENKSWERKLQ